MLEGRQGDGQREAFVAQEGERRKEEVEEEEEIATGAFSFVFTFKYMINYLLFHCAIERDIEWREKETGE